MRKLSHCIDDKNVKYTWIAMFLNETTFGGGDSKTNFVSGNVLLILALCYAHNDTKKKMVTTCIGIKII